MITDNFPFEEFKVYDEWMPDRVDELFIAESPPENGYFYDVDFPGTGRVSDNIFKLLSIDVRMPKSSKLTAFKRENRFLTDVIKCRKRASVRAPKSLALFSGRELLGEEVNALSPRTIILLGRLALAGLRQAEGFRNIGGGKSVVDLAGTQERIKASAREYRIVYSIFPSCANIRNYGEELFERAFSLI
ncbi:MAG: uracil-DNA glycosylase family protein [Candidatus Thermoplasmatota archaeon]